MRFGLRVASLGVRVGLQSAERAVAVVSTVARVVRPGTDSTPAPGPEASAASDPRVRTESNGASAVAEPPPFETPTFEPPPSPPVAEADLAPPAATDPDLAPPGEPGGEELPDVFTELEDRGHVSEEATLVESFAEPGAEDGAGAEVTIEEPWEGYSRMNAKDVIARADEASDVELAAAELYEQANRRRETVLDALARGLARKQNIPPDTTK